MSDDLTFEEAFNFVEERVAEETEDFSGELPDHAASLLVSTSNDLLQTVTNTRIIRADEDADDPTDEQVAEALAEDAVDLLLALGSLRAEYDLDIAEAFSDRMSFVQNYQDFEAAIDDSSSPEEIEEAFDTHMDESMEEVMGGMGIEAGDNVDDDDYEPKGINRDVM
jgi:hypothetical protein